QGRRKPSGRHRPSAARSRALLPYPLPASLAATSVSWLANRGDNVNCLRRRASRIGAPSQKLPNGLCERSRWQPFWNSLNLAPAQSDLSAGGRNLSNLPQAEGGPDYGFDQLFR